MQPRHPFASPEDQEEEEGVRTCDWANVRVEPDEGPFYLKASPKIRGLTLAKRVNHQFQRLHPVFAPLWFAQQVTPKSGPFRRDTRNICRHTKHRTQTNARPDFAAAVHRRLDEQAFGGSQKGVDIG